MKDFAMAPIYDDNREFFDREMFFFEEDIEQLRLSRCEVIAH